MSKRSTYDVEMEFSDDNSILSQAKDLDETLTRLKRRERIYYGLIGAVLVAAVGFGVQYSVAEEPSSTIQSASGYTQDISNTNTGYNNYGYATGAGAPTGGGGCGGGGETGGGCGGSGTTGGGGCGGGGTGAAKVDIAALTKEFKAFYAKTTGTPEKDFEAVVSDRGCHTQCDILVKGQIVKSYSYRNGAFEPI